MKKFFIILFLLFSGCGLLTKEIPYYITKTDTLTFTDTLKFTDTLTFTDTLKFTDTLMFTDTLSLSESLKAILQTENSGGNVYFIFQNINDSSLKYIPFKKVKYIKDSTKQYFGILPK